MGWSFGAGLVFGLALSVASTVVLLNALESRGILDSINGRIAVGWLIVEDLAMVLVLVLLPSMAGFPAAARSSTPADWSNAAVDAGPGRPVRRADADRRPPPVPLAAVAVGGPARASFHVVRDRGGDWRRQRLGPAVRRVDGVGRVLRRHGHARVELSHRAADECCRCVTRSRCCFRFGRHVVSTRHAGQRTAACVRGGAGIVLGKVNRGASSCSRSATRSTALTVSASLAQIGEFSFIPWPAWGCRSNFASTGRQHLILVGA